MAVTEGQANKDKHWEVPTSPKTTGPYELKPVATLGCYGEHTYYMASEIEVPERGKLILVGFCTHCANPMRLEFDILRK